MANYVFDPRYFVARRNDHFAANLVFLDVVAPGCGEWIWGLRIVAASHPALDSVTTGGELAAASDGELLQDRKSRLFLHEQKTVPQAARSLLSNPVVP